VKIRNADLSWEVWCSLVKRRYRVFVEPSVAADVWGVEKRQIYKMWAQMVIILPGEPD